MINKASIYYNLYNLQRKLNKDSRKGRKFYKLYELITSNDNIMAAYRNIKSNKGSTTAGIDKITIREVEKIELRKFLRMINKKFESYTPEKVRKETIPKPNGKIRVLGIPALIERIMEQAIKQVLEPIFEAKFYKHSYGFRPGLSQYKAISTVNLLISNGYTYSVDMDIESFFDNINHSKIIRILWTNGIRDKRLLTIIKKKLKAPIAGVGIPIKGAIQGGVLSPLLANIYLNELDQWVASQWTECGLTQNRKKTTKMKRGIIIRYADDFKILAKSRNEAKRWFFCYKDVVRGTAKIKTLPRKE